MTLRCMNEDKDPAQHSGCSFVLRKTYEMAESTLSLSFDKTSSLWIQPFSAIINCMFPVEYVYGDWFYWQAILEGESQIDPELAWASLPTNVDTGSRVEGFCIPQFFLSKSDVAPLSQPVIDKEQWQPDRDKMSVEQSFVENKEKVIIPIFTVEHATDNPRYVKLRLTSEWKEYRPKYKNTSFLHHAYMLPSTKTGQDWRKAFFGSGNWSYDLHGPVAKHLHNVVPCFELDETNVFKYPTAWPEPAMEWLIRPRRSGWPSAVLVQEIFESSCHLAPVGRGKRSDEPTDLLEYVRNPESACKTTDNEYCHENKLMDETEWRISFSLAENKLGRSVTPVQRNVIILLKMIKKLYFPEVISSYHLKNLLFWECESREESFWREDNSARCILTLLDRLQECLEQHCLPHYITPQSNLLQDEDPAKLVEIAAIVADVRRNILPKTVELLMRLQSLTYQSQIFLKDLELGSYLAKVQDQTLTEPDMNRLLHSLYSIFAVKCKDVISNLINIRNVDDNVQTMLNIPLYAYQSLLARNLCRLWFLKCAENSSTKTSEEEFNAFVTEETAMYSRSDEIAALTDVYFSQMKKQKHISMLVPGPTILDHMKMLQKRVVVKQQAESYASIEEGLGCLLQRTQ